MPEADKGTVPNENIGDCFDQSSKGKPGPGGVANLRTTVTDQWASNEQDSMHAVNEPSVLSLLLPTPWLPTPAGQIFKDMHEAKIEEANLLRGDQGGTALEIQPRKTSPNLGSPTANSPTTYQQTTTTKHPETKSANNHQASRNQISKLQTSKHPETKSAKHQTANMQKPDRQQETTSKDTSTIQNNQRATPLP